MKAQDYFIPSGKLAKEQWKVLLSAQDAKWSFSGLRIGELASGDSISFDSGEYEMVIISLEGSAQILVNGNEFTLEGRKNVFCGPSDLVYVPINSKVTVSSSTPCKFAVPSAKTDVELPVRYVSKSEVPIEIRGAGSCTRQVHNFCTPESLEAGRLIACEVITPSGNWSSYPPHKHDRLTATERPLEEIYYFEVARAGGSEGMAYQRVYSSDQGEIDILAEVRSGDLVLIPYGWHGPSMAVPGYDLYYLNVMAGPSGRQWMICDDPEHAWVRSLWPSQAIDPRVPFHGEPGEL